MLAYIILILLICFDFLIEKYFFNSEADKKKGNSKIYLLIKKLIEFRIITISALVFLSTFKALSVGYDTNNYYEYYSNFLNGEANNITHFELGFKWLNTIFAWFKLDFRVLLFVVSLFVSITFVTLIRKISINKFLSIFLYIALGIFAQSLSAIRQIIAITIICYVIIALQKIMNCPSNDKLKYRNNLIKNISISVFLILIASLFHKSAIVCLILIPFSLIKPKPSIIIFSFLSCILLGIFLPTILMIIEKTISLDYYSKYYIESFVNYVQASDLLNNLYSIGLVAIFIFLYILRNKVLVFENNKEERLYDFALFTFMIVPLIRIIGFLSNTQALLNRLSMYFFPILILLIPLFLKSFKVNKKLSVLTTMAIYLGAGLYMYYLYAIKFSCGVVPYIINFY